MEKRRWTEEEIRVLKENWGKVSKEELEKLLPGRSFHSLHHKASRMRIPRACVKALLKPRRIPKLSLEEKIYTAGIIDGEGTITLYVHGGIVTPLTDISNNHKGLITWLRKHLGGGTGYTQTDTRGNRRPTYHVKFTRLLDVKALLEQILPYLIAKKKQAELVLEYCNLRLQDKALEYNPKLYEIAIQVRRLNERSHAYTRDDIKKL